MIIVSTFLLSVFVSTIAQCSIPDNNSASAMHKTEEIFEGGFSPQEIIVAPHEVFSVDFSICPTKDASNTVIKFVVPETLVQLVDGPREWTGDVKKGETVALSFSFVAQEEVKATVRADVKTSLKPLSSFKYASSFSLQIAADDAAAGAGPCKIMPVSDSDLPTTSNPESLRAISSPKATEPAVGSDQLRFYGTFWYINDQGGYSPARYMNVRIMDSDTFGDELVWSGWTDANGYYDVVTDNDDGFLQDGRDPYVQLWAMGQYDWETKNGDDDTYVAQTAVLKEDCDGGEEFSVGGVPSANNEAWLAGDACWQEADWVWSHTSPSWEIGYRVTIYWPVGTWDYSQGDSILLHSGFGGHVTVMHEYGHCVLWNAYGGSWPEGCTFPSHWVGMESTLADAWDEGWAEFMQCVVENNPNNLQGNGQNIETNTWWSWADPAFGDGAVIEGEVASILWDIYDPIDVSGDDDHISWGYNEIFTVLLNGDAGADDNPNSILEFWDDWESRWPDVTTSMGPLCDIYWNYGIDEDWYAPWGSILINGGATYTNSRTVTLTLSADDWGAGVERMRFSEDAGATWGPWYSYSTTFSYTIARPGDGFLWIDVQFGDPWFGSEAGTIYDSIILDTTPPTGSVIINGGAAYTNSRTVALTLSASDATSSVEYMRFSENMGAWSSWVPYTTSYTFTLTSVNDGYKSVDVQFKDTAGNPTAVWTIWDGIYLDTTPPTGGIVIGSGNPTYTTSTSVTLYLTYSDSISGVYQVRYGNAGGSWGAWEAPSATKAWTLFAGDGAKSVYYQIKDNVGFISEYNDDIVLDTTMPTGSIIINSGNPPTTTTTSVTLYLTYSDATSGVYQVRYGNLGGSWSAWMAPTATKAWTLTEGDGMKTVYYQIKDNAGWVANVSDSIVLQTTVEENAYLVVRGSSNGIYCRIYDCTEECWGDWTELPGSTPDSPAAVVAGGEFHMVVRGVNNGQLWHCYTALGETSFSGWSLLSGATPSPPTLTGNSTHLCLVVRGNNNMIYYRFYAIASRVWGGWVQVPGGATPDTPAARLVGDELHLVVKGSNYNQIWHGIVDLTSGGFSGWSLLSGATPSPPTLTGNSTHLCLVVRGNTNLIFYRFYDLAAESWGGWVALPYGTTPDVPAATIVGDDLHIVVRGVNYDQIWHGCLNLGSDAWSGWNLLDGATPSKPVLTS
jgi:hypothetical protein